MVPFAGEDENHGLLTEVLTQMKHQRSRSWAWALGSDQPSRLPTAGAGLQARLSTAGQRGLWAPPLSSGVSNIFTRGHMSLEVASKGLNVILGLYKCNYCLTRGNELGAAAG